MNVKKLDIERCIFEFLVLTSHGLLTEKDDANKSSSSSTQKSSTPSAGKNQKSEQEDDDNGAKKSPMSPAEEKETNKMTKFYDKMGKDIKGNAASIAASNKIVKSPEVSSSLKKVDPNSNPNSTADVLQNTFNAIIDNSKEKGKPVPPAQRKKIANVFYQGVTKPN